MSVDPYWVDLRWENKQRLLRIGSMFIDETSAQRTIDNDKKWRMLLKLATSDETKALLDIVVRVVAKENLLEKTKND